MCIGLKLFINYCTIDILLLLLSLHFVSIYIYRYIITLLMQCNIIHYKILLINSYKIAKNVNLIFTSWKYLFYIMKTLLSYCKPFLSSVHPTKCRHPFFVCCHSYHAPCSWWGPSPPARECMCVVVCTCCRHLSMYAIIHILVPARK